jgi:predicted KAP-like P-loop ATPase
VKIIKRIKLLGDYPRESIRRDEFGLEKIVCALSDTLTQRVTRSGYTLGIQGQWGSGKTTLVNFVAEKIKAEEPWHHTIKFDPWLLGEKNALLPFFLGQLATKIDDISIRRL